MKKTVLSLLILFLLLSACAKMNKPNPVNPNASKQNMEPADHVISHRGASFEAPEHSLAAYDLAIAYGSKYIEQDLVISADGTLYVSHDLSPVQFNGDDTPYENLSDQEIDALRAPDGRSVLRMSDVFERYGDSVNYVIELKRGMKEIESFVKLVRESGLEDRIVLQSLDIKVLILLEKYFPNMPKIFLTMEQKKLERALGISCVDIISPSYDLMTEQNCEMVHAAGKQFSAWTLDYPDIIKTAITLGVDIYFTNDTNLALQLEAEYRRSPDE